MLSNSDFGYNQSSSYLPQDSSSSSDSDDLEVVEAGTPLSSSFEANQDESPYRTSNFYSQSYDSDKNEQEEPSYSLDDPPNNYNDFDSSFNESSSTKKHSTKKMSSSKKSSSSKNSHTSNQVKSKKEHKRKHDNDEFDLNASPKKKKKSSDTLPHNNKKSSKTTSYHKKELSDSTSSSDSDEDESYKSSYSNFNSPPYPNTVQSKSLTILDDDDFSDTAGKHNSQKKNNRTSFHKASLKTPLESSNKGNLLMVFILTIHCNLLINVLLCHQSNLFISGKNGLQSW